VGFQSRAIARVSGSGDKAYHYVQVFCVIVTSSVLAAVWSFLDRRRPGYPGLFRHLRTLLRYQLAAAMIGYGAVKVVKTQFPTTFLYRLTEPLGGYSPMGRLWMFLGLSEPYSIFTWAVEMLGGLLLTTRRTALLGALISAGVMANVLMLNLCFDVPVKIYSAHLLFLCAVIIAPDSKRLADFFVFNRPVGTAPPESLFRSPALDRLGVALRTLAFAGLAVSSLHQSYERRKSFDLAPRGPLHGIWDIEQFELDGQIVPQLLTDSRIWRRVVIESRGSAESCQMNIQTTKAPGDSRRAEVDPARQTIRVVKRPDEVADPFHCTYVLAEPDRLMLEGTIRKHEGREAKVRASLRRFDESSYPLLSRGFHWINESPFSR
jgi:hypothetical protein